MRCQFALKSGFCFIFRLFRNIPALASRFGDVFFGLVLSPALDVDQVGEASSGGGRWKFRRITDGKNGDWAHRGAYANGLRNHVVVEGADPNRGQPQVHRGQHCISASDGCILKGV